MGDEGEDIGIEFDAEGVDREVGYIGLQYFVPEGEGVVAKTETDIEEGEAGILAEVVEGLGGLDVVGEGFGVGAHAVVVEFAGGWVEAGEGAIGEGEELGRCGGHKGTYGWAGKKMKDE